MVDKIQVEKLKKTTSNKKLLKYLEKELGWPIDTEDLEDNFFDYSPEELQLKPDLAAKIKTISRLRPPSSKIKMPWGIFFIEFSTKNLPLLALRRILNQFVEKKRQSKDLQSWEMGDLLFVSNYGVDEQRKISLCLFNDDKEKSSLPRLKVIEWSDQDTDLSLEGIANTLKENLEWPDEDLSKEDWKVQWQSAFVSDYKAVITTSKVLAHELAELAKEVRNRLKDGLAIEHENGYLHQQLELFRKVLIHDLDEKKFADMYAQTIAYGLLTAEITNPKTNEGDRIGQIAITNPFLKELLKSFLEPNEQLGASNSLNFDELGISEIKELLDNSDMPLVIRDFGTINPQEDPVIYFYELFLKEYDSKEKKKRGVFYTPRPVVSFIVRSVDELLRKEFNLKYGLADTTTWGEMIKQFDGLEIPEGATHDQAFVQILDPATGTGTFLVETIDLIYKTMTDKWQSEGHNKSKIGELWNEYVPTHLLPRLHGYELMMAPYAIAHMKIGLKLYEKGYLFESNEHTRIFLTNSLEPAEDLAGTFDFALPVLANEAKIVNKIKRDCRFTVVIGNPPYAANSSNMSNKAKSLVEDKYKKVDGEPLNSRNPKWLQADENKFISFSQDLIDLSGLGVLSFITPHKFINSQLARGMRFSLQSSFQKITILDLHGNKTSQEISPTGANDNVFDIKQGVAISSFTKNISETKEVFFHENWGDREYKYNWLDSNSYSSIDWETVECSADSWPFTKFDSSLQDEFDKFWSINDIFPISNSIPCTSRDHFVIDDDKKKLIERITKFRDIKISNSEIREEFFKGKTRNSAYPDGDTKTWKIPDVRKKLQSDKEWKNHFKRCLYRPFYYRHIYWSKHLIDRHRPNITRSLLSGNNLSLISRNQMTDGNITFTFVGLGLPIDGVIRNDNKGLEQIFPLYIEEEKDVGGLFQENNNLRPNLDQIFKESFPSSVRKKQKIFSPENIFSYIYSVLYSEKYRNRYSDLIISEYPRIPSSPNIDLFKSLSKLGNELIEKHTLRFDFAQNLSVVLEDGKPFIIQEISYSNETIWINKERSHGFKDVSEEVWNFCIGNHQICKKWLKTKKDLSNMVLDDEDIKNYQMIIFAISETIRIMKEIDEAIEEHGGWPDAFLNKE